MDPGFSVPVSEEKILPEVITTPADLDQPVNNLDKKAQADLIDKFISLNPRIEPRTDKTEHPVVDLSTPVSRGKGGTCYRNSGQDLCESGLLFKGDRYL